MKRLLLVFILFPVILFGQTRRDALVDSIKADTTNLQGVSSLITHKPGIKVEDIQASDSGGYVTIVVRVHVAEAVVITVLPVVPVVKIITGDIGADMVGTVALPPFPDVETKEALPLLAVTLFRIEHIPVVKADMVTLPPLPDVKQVPVEALPRVAVTLLRIDDIVAGKADMVTVPPLPDIEIAEDIPLLEAVALATEYRSPGKMDTVVVPSFEVKKMPVTEMHLSEVGYGLLEKLEGFSPMLYALKDGGLTIGFGFFVPYGEGNKWRNGVTWEDAELMIRQKVPVYEGQVKQYINVPLTQNEFDALTMLAYNLGGFSKATSIVNDINRDDYDKLQSDWKRFVHSKAPGVMKGLVNRRKDELEVRNESNYQPERKIQILKN